MEAIRPRTSSMDRVTSDLINFPLVIWIMKHISASIGDIVNVVAFERNIACILDVVLGAISNLVLSHLLHDRDSSKAGATNMIEYLRHRYFTKRRIMLPRIELNVTPAGMKT